MSEVTKRQVPGDVFFEGLSEINEGALLEALDTKMTSLVSAVLATGNNGSLTLKLNVKRKGGVNQVVIEPKEIPRIKSRCACVCAWLMGSCFLCTSLSARTFRNAMRLRILPTSYRRICRRTGFTAAPCACVRNPPSPEKSTDKVSWPGPAPTGPRPVINS